ncbi:Dda helicase-like protein [Vibrio phage VPMS1]|uniref:Dda helicase-like protein n=1 Tax=Vibrio phage VPMS1 TaxID=1233488 RepID=UPI0003584B0F|nr:Dda helicase-like protein [Vibrio phage VPMS1]AFV51081.1 Dda helicase-like protein [Vibrio phage VPMS1]
MTELYIFDHVSDSLVEEVACYAPCICSNNRVVLFKEVFTDLPCDVQELLLECELIEIN